MINKLIALGIWMELSVLIWILFCKIENDI